VLAGRQFYVLRKVIEALDPSAGAASCAPETPPEVDGI
jgi:hypothetical protein